MFRLNGFFTWTTTAAVASTNRGWLTLLFVGG